jgi:hypothetical protein
MKTISRKRYRRFVPTLGADPEVMLSTPQGEIVSAIPVLRNNKYNPHDLGDGIRLYADNVLCEASFPPSKSVDAAVDLMRTVFSRIKQKLGDDFFIKPQAAHTFTGLPPKPDDDLVYRWLADKSGGIQIPEEWQVGCNPNWDAYDMDIRKQKPFADGLRTGSFHIHIGNPNYKDPKEEMLKTAKSKIQAIRMMDIYVGCASVLFDKDETAPQRKALYGKAGEFRETPYGVEYRVLGNYALRSPMLTKLVFDLTMMAMDKMEYADDILNLIRPEDVQAAINDNRAKLALDILMLAEVPSHIVRLIRYPYEMGTLAKEWDI